MTRNLATLLLGLTMATGYSVESNITENKLVPIIQTNIEYKHNTNLSSNTPKYILPPKPEENLGDILSYDPLNFPKKKENKKPRYLRDIDSRNELK